MIETAITEERAELLAIAQTMESAVPQLASRLGAWSDDLEAGLAEAASPLDAERTLEQATRALRHVWLQAAASSTSRTYRSPTQDEHAATPSGRFHNFGYERDLQPNTLERRCSAFFDSPPTGWPQDHVLFSSGQAAMNAVLTLLASRQAAPLRYRHAGSYFETVDLLALFTGRFERSEQRVDVLIAEPVWCDGERFGAHSFQSLAAQALHAGTRSIVVDSTLAGLDDDLNDLLMALEPNTEVFRLHSGLKLFQAGLELADVGIVSVYGGSGGDALRHIRTLQGSGLRFADVAALELPLFLDAPSTRRYECAIFAHNSALAAAARLNLALDAVYPDARHAPFVIFRLAGSDADTLDQKIAAAAQRQNLVFDQGGSFGFRSHRFETVRPEGKPPFLRVALGRRAGPSLDGILDLFRKWKS
ncbi:MAG: hypothetical protein JO348_15580 [Alphaproteobacteria bacterium]|nr:hypothetical protein [Alphaproteobacteria bacterium]MBV9541796.1 hypothetical protein [Alphaproteobacteria bacterium]MBV9905915.1 hypothetical protein [Alphaproteobacteria bacterium]